jgi:hypothetical protein
VPDLTAGELFIVVFIVVAVVTARWWPRIGQAVAERLCGGGEKPPGRDEPGPGTPPPAG